MTIVFDDHRFDELVDGASSLPRTSSVTVAVKEVATSNGRPGAVIAFDVTLPDGRVRKAAARLSARHWLYLADALRSRYPNLVEPNAR
jgi:hypothetical protein